METLPSEEELGAPFIAWLKANFGWLFTPSTSTAMLGQSFVYDEQGSLLAEYGNGGTQYGGQVEYIWLPTETGQNLLVGLLKGGQLYAVHTDHLGTPRLITNSSNKPVWQWPYSGFGSNLPSGVLMRVPANTGGPTPPPPPDPGPMPTFAGIGGATNTGLRRTEPLLGFNLRFAGQYFDAESGLNYNYFRSYQASQGRYAQPDPIGLDGGWNRSGYVGGNPLSMIDPLGLAGCVVNFPDYPIDTGFGFTSSNLGGHGGVLSYDARGATQYYEFGRYPPSNQYVFGDKRPDSEGNVRRIPVPDLVIDPKTGQPSSTSLEALKKALSDRAGHKTKTDLTCDKDADEKKINKYAKDFAKNQSRAPYSWKPWSSNQCRDFANRAVGAGR